MRKEVLLLSLIFLLIVHAGIVIAAFEEGGYSGYINGDLVVCGDGICDDIEKEISCSDVYLFDDGEKHDICFLSTCPIDCGRTLGEYVGEEIDAPICGDGICEGVEDKKICKNLDRIGTDFCVPPCTKEALCQPACLSDCGIIAKTAPQNYDLPIEMGNILDLDPDIHFVNGELIREPPYRQVSFYRFEDIQTSKECEEKKSEYCLLGVNNGVVELGLRKRWTFFGWLGGLFGLSQYKVYEVPYYQSLKIKGEEGGVSLGYQTYTEYIPIFDSIAMMEYSEGTSPRYILTKEGCINEFVNKYNYGKMPDNCSIEELSQKSFLLDYSRDQLAYLSYQCISSYLVEFRHKKIDDSCIEFREMSFASPLSETSSCLNRQDCLDVLGPGAAQVIREGKEVSQEELEEARNCYKKCDIDMDCAVEEIEKCLGKGESWGNCLGNALIECKI